MHTDSNVTIPSPSPRARKSGTAAAAVAARALTAIAGGYLLALAFTGAAAALLCRVGGLDRADAFVAAGMLAMLAWPLAAIVSYAARSAGRGAAWVFGAALLLGATAWLLNPLPRPV